MLLRILSLSILCLSLIPLKAIEIIEFHSDIVVESEDAIVVTETILIDFAKNKGKRGIFRPFPTEYKDKLGIVKKVGFEILSIEKNGVNEPYFMEKASNGKVIYVGDRNVFLPGGQYTYTLKYRTTRQLGFFDDYDELYFNITGNDWAFPIRKASATIHLPEGAPVVGNSAYSGPYGSKSCACEIDESQEGQVTFTMNETLRPGEGLTTAVAWPKGYVTEPDFNQKAKYFFKDNLPLIGGVLGVLGAFFWFLYAWGKVGRDPSKGAIYPRFEPPEGISPAAARYVHRMKYDQKTYTSAIVNMAVQGAVKIEEPSKKSFTLQNLNAKGPKLSREEQAAFTSLFAGGKSFIEMENENHSRISASMSALKNELKAQFKKTYFNLNKQWLIPGIILSLLAVATLLFSGPFNSGNLTMIFAALWGAGMFGMLEGIIRNVQAAARGIASWTSAMITALFAIPFVGVLVYLIWLNSTIIPSVYFILIGIVVLMLLLFNYLIKAPTVIGRKVMDELEGFIMYLGAAEKDRLNILNPPEMTPEHFEECLPYAIALNIESNWGDYFNKTIIAAGENPRDYQPTWYGGHYSGYHFGNIGTHMSSDMGGAISSSAIPPGSSSGSGGFSGGGGGGFSGGGGGGGGGGAW